MRKQTRIAFLFWFQLMIFLLLGARLVDLQLISGEKNRILAEENRVKRIFIPTGRGLIYDRLGLPLVENIPLYRREQGNGDDSTYETISREKALEIESAGGEEAEKVRVDVGRRYLHGEVLAHLLGYVGQVNREEVSSSRGRLEPGVLVGRGGVEEEYDHVLRGKKGVEIIETDAHGEKKRVIGQVEAQAGQDLKLAIDLSLSQAALKALEGQRGAVVATKARTGEVLALVSSPAYDPNKLSLGISLAKFQEFLADPGQPFFNRAIGGAYPPGSTFKIVTAVAGLEEGEITGQTLINDPGMIQIGPFAYRNWYFTQYGQTEGEINIITAIKRSTDTYFYKVGEWLGAERLADWAKYFGLGKQTKIDLPGEIDGLVPDPQWKRKIKGERWFLGNTYHLAIGQADLTATPLQVNMMTAAIANGGQFCRPRVTKKTPNEETNCQDLKIKKETLGLVKEGMKEACSFGGTAFPFFDFKPQVACKTGTAQFGDPEERTHAWLTAFAPVDDPEIVVTVLVEAGGEGSKVAAPMAKQILEAWFKD